MVKRPESSAGELRRTHCRICEPQCGLVATVREGRIVKMEGDKDHVFSRGFLCIKGVAAADVIYNEDRVLTPLKRAGGPGEFEPVSWDVAMSDIAARLAAIRKEHGASAFATFMGNPPAHGFANTLGLSGLQETLGVRWRFTVNGDDAAARLAANALLFGAPDLMLRADLWRSDFVIIIGANPFVSHGSLISEPKLRDALNATVGRGGRVVVIDPRRTETAKHFEHVPVRPGADAYLLIGMILATLEAGLTRPDYLERHVRGFDRLASILKTFDLEECAQHCGVAPETIRSLACDFARAERGVLYGRLGTCVQRFGTLNNFLQDVVNVLSGKIEAAGGYVFGWDPLDDGKTPKFTGRPTIGRIPTRVYGSPDVWGRHPSTSLAPEILTPGSGQIRALLMMGANPVISSAGGGERLAAALETLDLHFSLDLYVNETNRHAHYILPVAHMYERPDIPVMYTRFMLRPSLWFSEAVVPPRGEARQEWDILQELARRLGHAGAYAAPWMRRLAAWGMRLRPETLIDLKIRNGLAGDRFGLRPGGLNLRKLRKRYPNGVQLRDELPVGNLWKRIRTADGKIDLCPDPIVAELARLRAFRDDPAYPARLIGMRELKSHNAWLHNVARVMPPDRRHVAYVNPADVSRYGLGDGDEIRLISKSGEVQTPIKLTEDVSPGTVAMPHGWGHNGGWRRANAAGGVNSNRLASGAREDVEALAGMSILTGIPVRIEPASGQRRDNCS